MDELGSLVKKNNKNRYRTKTHKLLNSSPKSIVSNDTLERNSFQVHTEKYKQFISKLKTERSQQKSKIIQLPQLKFYKQPHHIKQRKFASIENQINKSKLTYQFSFEKPLIEKQKQSLRKMNQKYPNRQKTKSQIIKKHINKIIKKDKIQIQYLKADSQCLYSEFKKNFAFQLCINKYFNLQIKGKIGKLLFYVGMSLEYQMREHLQNTLIIKDQIQFLHYQIYYSLKLGINQIFLQSLKNCGQIYQLSKNYIIAKHFFIKLLKLSLLKKNKHYEDIAVEKIGICQYHNNQVCQAQYFHNNIGKITNESKVKICRDFSQEGYLQQLHENLFNEHKQFTIKIDENEKYQIIFQNPRPIQEEYHNKKVNNAIENIIEMQKNRRLKRTAQIMTKKIIINSQMGKVLKKNLNQINRASRYIKRDSEIKISRNFKITKSKTTTKLKMQIQIFLTILRQLYQ